MTLSANRDQREPANVVVRTTYGPVVCEVTEHESHAASFHAQLGRLLAENPDRAVAQAREGYTRYIRAADPHAERLPAWEDLEAAERDHWRAAFAYA